MNRVTYCPIRYDGTEPCMGAPCALAVRSINSGNWVCSLSVNQATVSGGFAFNLIAKGTRKHESK